MAVVEVPQTQAKANWLYDARIRSIFFQLLTVVLLVGFLVWLSNNTIENLDARGIATGFKFLSQPAGFSVAFSLIPYSEASSYGTAFIVSVLNTIFVSVLGIILATIVGFLIGIMRLSKNWIVAKLATVYLETLRNVPLLLQILFWYFAVLSALPQIKQSLHISQAVFLNNRGIFTPRPIFEDGFGAVVLVFFAGLAVTWMLTRWARRRQETTGEQFPVIWAVLALLIVAPALAFVVAGSPLSWEIPVHGRFRLTGGVQILPELLALLLALSLYTAAFIGEIVRAGIQAVSHGQTEAAYALGIRPRTTMRLIVIPQAMRVIVPPLTSQYLNLTKNSSLAAAIAYPELVHVFAGTVLNQTGQAIECILITMLVYLTISLVISSFMNWYNQRIALVER